MSRKALLRIAKELGCNYRKTRTGYVLDDKLLEKCSEAKLERMIIDEIQAMKDKLLDYSYRISRERMGR